MGMQILKRKEPKGTIKMKGKFFISKPLVKSLLNIHQALLAFYINLKV